MIVAPLFIGDDVMKNRTVNGFLGLIALLVPFSSIYAADDEQFCISMSGTVDNQALAELQGQYTQLPLQSDYTQQLGSLRLDYDLSRRERRVLRKKVRNGSAGWQDHIALQLSRKGLNAAILGAVTGSVDNLPSLTHRYVLSNGSMISHDQVSYISGYTECAVEMDESINIVAGSLLFDSGHDEDISVAVTGNGLATGSISSGACPGYRNKFDVDLELCFVHAP
jgi:hypothetical protein